MNPWIKTYSSSRSSALRLFCFPYAGGAASLFRNWPQRFSARVEISAVQLPGRENRMQEPRFTDLYALAKRIADELAPLLHQKPFAFFGYSMGAILAFEVTRELRRRRLPMPLHLFVAASSPPQLAEHPDRSRSTLPDDELIAELRRLGGTPDELLEHEELLRLLLPILRADFSVVDTYRYRDEEPLDVPLSAFGGLEDHALPEEQLEGWRLQTRAPFTMQIFPGNHFFLHAHDAELAAAMERLLPGVNAPPR
jgi:medium-chain acyl-[acyl-carrier-protein] hydrolase